MESSVQVHNMSSEVKQKDLPTFFLCKKINFKTHFSDKYKSLGIYICISLKEVKESYF